MHQTRKGKQWYFGTKMHIGVNSQTGLTHSAVVTAANWTTSTRCPTLVHGNEQRVYGASAYASQKTLIESQAKDFTNQRVRKGGEIGRTCQEPHKVEGARAGGTRLRRGKAAVGMQKSILRELVKNATRAFVALGLANLYLPRGVLYA